MDENISDNAQYAYALAEYYREERDNRNAEKFALSAMELGCENKAPILLAKIALETKSKSTAMTLSSYYWEQGNTSQAEKWATLAQQFGSTVLAPKRLDEIQAHNEALVLHEVVENFSPPVDDIRDDMVVAPRIKIHK